MSNAQQSHGLTLAIIKADLGDAKPKHEPLSAYQLGYSVDRSLAQLRTTTFAQLDADLVDFTAAKNAHPGFGFKLANGFSDVMPPIVKTDAGTAKPTCFICGCDEPIVKQNDKAYCFECTKANNKLVAAFHPTILKDH